VPGRGALAHADNLQRDRARDEASEPLMWILVPLSLVVAMLYSAVAISFLTAWFFGA
jgi:hypothetical protein